MTICWKAVEQYFTVLLFVFQFYLVCNLGKLINFELGTAKSERVEVQSKGNNSPEQCLLTVQVADL